MAYSEKLAKADRDRLAEFLESVESAVSIIRNIRSTQIRPLNVGRGETAPFSGYVNGFHDDEGTKGYTVFRYDKDRAEERDILCRL